MSETLYLHFVNAKGFPCRNLILQNNGVASRRTRRRVHETAKENIRFNT